MLAYSCKQKIVELDATGDDGYAHLKDKLNGPEMSDLNLTKFTRFQLQHQVDIPKVDDFFGATAVGDVFTFTYTDVVVTNFWSKNYTATKSPDGTYYVGKFEVDNYRKSIFPRVGGTNSSIHWCWFDRYVDRRWAAWYIKRRQNVNFDKHI